MKQLQVEVPREFLKAIEGRLDEVTALNKKINVAANDVAKKTRKLLIQRMVEEYQGEVARKPALMKKSKIEKAGSKRFDASVIFKSPVYNIENYHVIPNPRRWAQKAGTAKYKKLRIKGNVLRSGTKPLDRAFFVTFRNGHTAVVERAEGKYVYKKKYRNTSKSRPRKRHPIKAKEKIRTLMSPSYQTSVGGRVYEKEADNIPEMMLLEIENVISRTLEKTK
ncbi:MAG: hypothetical protein Q4F24_08095 [Eubacteriales bacterium]|nr:hypothetical protein [Eubacteriales bacterium]